jgi:ORF6N domain
MFQLTADGVERSRSQIATLNSGRGQNIKYRPYAFTEHGAFRVANVLNSPPAIPMGVYVVGAFVQLRDLLASNKPLAQKLSELEHKLKNRDEAIAAIRLWLTSLQLFVDRFVYGFMRRGSRSSWLGHRGPAVRAK